MTSPQTSGRAPLVGDCISAFDADGCCLVDRLPWAEVTHFAVAEETAVSVGRETFMAAVELPQVLSELPPDSVRYLRTRDGVYMLYDEEADIHHLFAGSRLAPEPTVVTLYRCEAITGGYGRRPTFETSNFSHQAMLRSGEWDAVGRWFTDEPELLIAHAQAIRAEGDDFRVVKVLVDAGEAESWRPSNPRLIRFSSDPANDYLIPREVAEAAVFDANATQVILAEIAGGMRP